MTSKDILRDIREREIDRKTFLRYCGLTVLSLVGLRTVVTLLTKLDDKKPLSSPTNSNVSTTNGFGGGKYGA